MLGALATAVFIYGPINTWEKNKAPVVAYEPSKNGSNLIAETFKGGKCYKVLATISYRLTSPEMYFRFKMLDSNDRIAFSGDVKLIVVTMYGNKDVRIREGVLKRFCLDKSNEYRIITSRIIRDREFDFLSVRVVESIPRKISPFVMYVCIFMVLLAFGIEILVSTSIVRRFVNIFFISSLVLVFCYVKFIL